MQPLTQDTGTSRLLDRYFSPISLHQGKGKPKGNKESSAGLGLVLKALCSIVSSIICFRLLVWTHSKTSEGTFVSNK